MPARFYAPAARRVGDTIALPDDEAQHLERVLRLRAGDTVRVFDGLGLEFAAVVERVSRAGADVRLESRSEPASEPSVAVTVAMAVLKSDRMNDAVRDAVMLGAAAIQPFVASRSEISAAAIERSRRQARWQKIALASAKQCGRAVVPPILAPAPLHAVLEALDTGALPLPAWLLVEPSAGVAAPHVSSLPPAPPAGAKATVLIGPEGGWSPEELARAAGLAQPLTLGGRTLRADAVPLVVLTALFTRWGLL